MRRPIALLRQLDKLWACVEELVEGGVGGGTIGPPGPKGDKGDPGDPGPPGNDGAPGSDGQAGPPGPKGDTGDTGPAGATGNDGNDGTDGAPGNPGPSAYQVAVANGFQGNEAQWLASLVGPQGQQGGTGDTGPTGSPGTPGTNGSDGNDGQDGLSAYQVAVNNGFVGTEAQWLASLVGAQGEDGQAGIDGKTVLSGAGAPGAGTGQNGDFYINTTAWTIYGPKASGAWGSPTALVGPQGIQGEPGTGADPWTKAKLSADFSNSTTTFNTVTGWNFTPPANQDWILEVDALVQTAVTTSVPRLGLNVIAGQSYGSCEIEFATSATAKGSASGWWTTALTNVQVPAGTSPVQGQPYWMRLRASGRSGASPTAINVQLAAEVGGNAALVKRGSELRWRAAA